MRNTRLRRAGCRAAAVAIAGACLTFPALAQSGAVAGSPPAGQPADQTGQAPPAPTPTAPTPRKPAAGHASDIDAIGFWGVDVGRGSDAAGLGSQAVTSVRLRLGIELLTLRASFDRVRGAGGGSAEFGLWLPYPLCRKVITHCKDKLTVIPEAVLGHHWGPGFGGYGALGGGLGWAFSSGRDGLPIIPYMEYRRRFSFHGVARGDGEVVVGVLFSFGYWD